MPLYSRPVRIVLVNWARIWDGAVRGGGVNGYCQSLALGLVQRGHDVVYLSSGDAYTPARPKSRPRCHVRRHPDWSGIRVFEVYDSPVLAPSFDQFRDPEGETSSPELEERVRELFDAIAPDVVHFHNVEGFSAGCIDAARTSGAAVLYSLHNYHPICPQVYLMQGCTRPCFDAEGGNACEGCIDAPDPEQVLETRRALPIANQQEPTARFPVTTAVLGELGGLFTPAPTDEEDTPPDTTVEFTPDSASKPMAHPHPDPRGGGEQFDFHAHMAFRRRDDDPEWRPLTNEIVPEPTPLDEGTRYGRRRRRMVEALNACDALLAVSEFVRRKYASYGLDDAFLRTLTIGTRIGEIVEAHRELVFDPPPFEPARPVRLVFMGHSNYYKGAHVLADALELLTPDELTGFDLSVFAQHGSAVEWRFRRLEPRLAKLTFAHGYQPHDVPWICGGRDLGVVPSVWWDNAPQTVFEFQACGLPVLGAELGGIPEFVREGENGMLFRGNDRDDLARRLRDIVRDPDRLATLRKGVRPPKTMDAHVGELETLYEGLRARSGVR